MNRTHKRLAAIAAALGLAVLIVWGFVEGRREAALERERERPVAAPLRVSTENGERVVRLDAEALRRNGIEVAALAPADQAPEVRAFGSVIDIGPLADLRAKQAAADAELRAARARLEASRREHARVKALFEDDRNASARAMEAAEAALRSDEAAAAAAETASRSLQATARETWGPVIAGWLAEGGAPLDRLLGGQDVLIRFTVPPGIALAGTPESAIVQAGASPEVKARLVSRAARTDPRIQGASFYYVAPATSGLVPGMNVVGVLRGKHLVGALVPESAVVRWEGRAWIYLAKGADTFSRRGVVTDAPANGGYVVQDLSAGTRVVTRGAQVLLSEEFRTGIEVLEEHEG